MAKVLSFFQPQPLFVSWLQFPASLAATLRLFGPKGWLLSLLGMASTLVFTGIPTEMIQNPWFTRMTPVRTQDYVFWMITSVLMGLIIGSFAVSSKIGGQGKALSGGFISYLAIGCPICNKIVVLLLGVSGALSFFAPLQFYLGLGSVLLLLWTLRLRTQSLSEACPLSAIQRPVAGG